jgi:signal transduction histidine kinase
VNRPRLLSIGRPWVFDTTLALVFLVGGQVEASMSTADGFTGGSPVASRVVTATVALSLVLRRAAPRACLLLASAGMLLPSLLFGHDLYFWTELLPMLFVVYPLARYVDGPLGRWGWLLVFVSVDSVFLHDPGAREWGNVVFLVFMLGTTTLAGRLVRRGANTRRRLAQALADLAEEHRAAETAAVEAERARIMVEVQDVVAHAVGVMQLQIGAARLALVGEAFPVPEQLRAAEGTGRRALAELRRSVSVREAAGAPAPLEPLPDLAQVPELVRGFRSAGLDVRLVSRGDLTDLPPGLQLNAYRILQEALTNVLRHAGRVLVHAVLVVEDAEVVLEVRNPTGRGTRPQALPSGGHGLVGMRERASMFGGRLEAGPEGASFVVRAVLPVPQPDATVPAAHAEAIS